MKEFFMAALPWVCMGVAVAVAMVVLRHEQARKELLEADESLTAEEKQKKSTQRSSNMVWGMCIGECVGIALAEACDFPIAIGISVGMMNLFADMGKLLSLEPSDKTVQAKVAELRAYITEHFYNCTPEILSGLGQMYAGGGSMTENINKYAGEGTAEFTAEAIRIYCDNLK